MSCSLQICKEGGGRCHNQSTRKEITTDTWFPNWSCDLSLRCQNTFAMQYSNQIQGINIGILPLHSQSQCNMWQQTVSVAYRHLFQLTSRVEGKSDYIPKAKHIINVCRVRAMIYAVWDCSAYITKLQKVYNKIMTTYIYLIHIYVMLFFCFVFILLFINTLDAICLKSSPLVGYVPNE